jgi:hypothetical protein
MNRNRRPGRGLCRSEDVDNEVAAVPVHRPIPDFPWSNEDEDSRIGEENV